MIYTKKSKKKYSQIIINPRDPSKAMYFMDPVAELGKVYSEYIESFWKYGFDPMHQDYVSKTKCYAFKETVVADEKYRAHTRYRVVMSKKHKSSDILHKSLTKGQYDKLFLENFEDGIPVMKRIKKNAYWYTRQEDDDLYISIALKYCDERAKWLHEQQEQIDHLLEHMKIKNTTGQNKVDDVYQIDLEDDEWLYYETREKIKKGKRLKK